MLLHSVELGLKVVESADTCQAGGYHSYSLFLSMVRRTAPDLASRLHQGGSTKPFAISSPYLQHPAERRKTLRQDDIVHIRLSFQDDKVFAAFLNTVMCLPPETRLSLGAAEVILDSVATTPLQSPRAATTSYRELLDGAGENFKLRLAFLSPTTFRSQKGRNTLLPEPDLVFGSLLARWNNNSPLLIDIRLKDAISGGLRLSGYRLGTRMLDFGNYQEVGFYGQATYEASTELDTDQLRQLNALASFAYYSGIGAKTTMGMGQARRVDDARPLSHRAGSHP